MQSVAVRPSPSQRGAADAPAELAPKSQHVRTLGSKAPHDKCRCSCPNLERRGAPPAAGRRGCRYPTCPITCSARPACSTPVLAACCQSVRRTPCSLPRAVCGGHDAGNASAEMPLLALRAACGGVRACMAPGRVSAAATPPLHARCAHASLASPTLRGVAPAAPSCAPPARSRCLA